VRRERLAEFGAGVAVPGPRTVDGAGGDVPGDRGQGDGVPAFLSSSPRSPGTSSKTQNWWSAQILQPFHA